MNKVDLKRISTCLNAENVRNKFLDESYIPPLRPLLYLLALAATSTAVFMFMNHFTNHDTISRTDADLQIIKDIQQSDQVPRAKRAALALVNLSLKLGAAINDNTLSKERVRTFTTVAAKKLSDTGEDDKLAELTKNIRSLPNGGYGVQ